MLVTVFQLTQRKCSNAIWAHIDILNITECVCLWLCVFVLCFIRDLFALLPCVHTNRSAGLANYTTKKHCKWFFCYCIWMCTTSEHANNINIRYMCVSAWKIWGNHGKTSPIRHHIRMGTNIQLEILIWVVHTYQKPERERKILEYTKMCIFQCKWNCLCVWCLRERIFPAKQTFGLSLMWSCVLFIYMLSRREQRSQTQKPLHWVDRLFYACAHMQR